ncbi:DUF4249 family protein [Ekhidna sp.]
MNKISSIFIAFLFFACSEPYEFEKIDSEVFIFDAKISTIEGNSYVKIQKTKSNVDENALMGLDVKVLSSEGAEFAFIYNSEVGSYLPQSSTFAAEVGVSYMLRATTEDGLIFESAQDTVPAIVDFDVLTKDTTVFEVSSANTIVEKEAIATLAQLNGNTDNVYAVFQYGFKYADFYTLDTSNLFSQDEFTLFNSISTGSNTNNFEIPLGIYKRRNWRFVDYSPECDEQRVFLFECPFPCCSEFERWLVEFYVNLESVSPAVFKYWEGVQRLRSNDGLVFDTYPFQIKGNVSCVNCDFETVGLLRAVFEVQSRKLESL